MAVLVLLQLLSVNVAVATETWHCPSGYCLERKYANSDIASSFQCSKHAMQFPDLCALEGRNCRCEGYTKFGDPETASWTDEMEANGTALTCERSVYGNDPARGTFKMCVCRADGEQYFNETSMSSSDYKPLAVVSESTSSTEIDQFGTDGYEMGSAVDCVHWILAIDMPKMAVSLMSESHVLLLGGLLLGSIMPGEVQVWQVAKSESTRVTFRIEVESMEEILQRIARIDYADLKAWGIEQVKPVDATIAAGMELMEFSAPFMEDNPDMSSTSDDQSESSTAVLISCQFGWLAAWLACVLQA